MTEIISTDTGIDDIDEPLDEQTLSEGLATIPRLSGDAPAPDYPRKQMPFRKRPWAQWLERSANQMLAAGQFPALDEAWGRVQRAAEGVEAASGHLDDLGAERAAMTRRARDEAFRASRAGKTPKPVKATVDFEAEHAARQGAYDGARAAVQAARADYDRVWAAVRSAASQALAARVPEALQDARASFADAEAKVREALQVLNAAARVAVEAHPDSPAVKAYADEQNGDLGQIRKALDTISAGLRAEGLGDWLTVEPDALVYPTLRQRERMAASPNAVYELAAVEAREGFAVTAHTKPFAATLLASAAVSAARGY